MTPTIKSPEVGDRILTAKNLDPVEVLEVVAHRAKTGLMVYRCRVAMPSGAERWTSVAGVKFDGKTYRGF